MMVLGYKSYNDSFLIPKEELEIKNCLQKYHNKGQYWDSLITMPKWLNCGSKVSYGTALWYCRQRT